MTIESSAPLSPRPRRRFGLLSLILVGVLSAALAGGVALLLARRTGQGAAAASHVEADQARYQCPMHPSIVQDQHGESSGASKPPGERTILFYRSPMNPKQTSPTARKDDMGMDYVPVYSDAVSAGASPVAGLATVDIDPARQQLIGLKTTEVTQGNVGGAWRTVGRVAMDETRVRHINLKISGFIERIYVDFVGKQVRKGDPLFSIYSPELLSAQEEYLLALKTRGALTQAGGRVGDDGEALVAAARRKLSLWDIPQSEVDRIAKTGQPTKTLTFYSPLSGVVTKKDVVDGMRLEAGAMPYEIVDLSSVWVLADVYERELRLVKEGMPATLRLNAFPNREFKGKVVFIDPVLNPQTRTVKVRLTFPNPTGELRPEMFGEVVLQGVSREGLRIPPDAVIDSGTEKIVFVAIGEGKFQPRKVKLGESDGAQVEVVSGLEAGDRVVTRANFLVDSESRLRASLAEMSPGAAAPETASPVPDAGAPVIQDHGSHRP